MFRESIYVSISNVPSSTALDTLSSAVVITDASILCVDLVKPSTIPCIWLFLASALAIIDSSSITDCLAGFLSISKLLVKFLLRSPTTLVN